MSSPPSQLSGHSVPAVLRLCSRLAAIQSVTAAGLYIARQRGYFGQAGLHVTIVPTTGGSSAIPDLVTGRVQVVFGNYVSDILAQAEGAASLRFLADLMLRFGLLKRRVDVTAMTS